MKRKNIFEKLERTGIVPVVVLDRAEDAAPLAKALLEGGLPCAEVTFRTTAARESIQRIRKAYPDMLVGAGTVLSIDQVNQAKEAGAAFIVSPGLNPKVVSYCVEKEIPIIPGCMTPGEIEQALDFGLEVVKFFPAEAAGGLGMIKALKAPYKNLKFMPTGGITIEKAAQYLREESVLACGGSWMVKADLIQKGDFEQIARLTKEAAALVKKIKNGD